jgi:hypothetical protein
MTDNDRATNIKDGLDVSFEQGAFIPDKVGRWYPETAVLLVTRCCEINHDHINLNKEQAMALAEWLVAFANGEYDE